MTFDLTDPKDLRLLVDLVNEARGKSFGPPVVRVEGETRAQLERIADDLRPAARQVGLSI